MSGAKKNNSNNNNKNNKANTDRVDWVPDTILSSITVYIFRIDLCTCTITIVNSIYQIRKQT